MMSTHLAVVWHQTHTQFKGPGRAEDTVTGTPVWPKFALKSVGLAFVTFATLTLMGGLFQINPVWFYGPYVPYTGPSPSQPDWYAGWLEGLLRLWPNWEFTIFGVTIGELFLPAIVVPGIMFTLLATWPFLEARFSKDHEWHNFAQKPREAPVRSALGAAAIGLMVVLFLAGSNDVLAKYLQIEVDTFNAVLKVLVFVLPVVVGVLTFMVCRDLRDRPRSPDRATRHHDRASDRRRRVRGDPRARYARRSGCAVTRRTALRGAAASGASALLLSACSGSFGMPRGVSEQAHETFTTWQIFFIVAIPVAGIVYVLMLWSLIRYRRRRSDDPDALGSQRKENLPLELVYTVIPIVIIIVLFVVSVRANDRVTDISPDPDLVVKVEAYAWGWRFSYPNGVQVVSPPSAEQSHEPVLVLPGEPHRADRADVQRHDPRVLGAGVPLQARRDPGAHVRVRRHADRTGHLPGTLRGVLRPEPRVHELPGAGAQRRRLRHVAAAGGGMSQELPAVKADRR